MGRLRYIIWAIYLLCFGLFGLRVAGAATFPDVPNDHWAYEAVSYLQQKGLVEGYPDGYFKGDRTLTRYEFAIVTARLYDKLVAEVGKGETPPPDVDAIYTRLQGEFSDDIQQLKDMLASQDARLTDVEKAFGDLSTRVDKDEKNITDHLGTVKVTADLRTRFESINPKQSGAQNTNRARYRLRVTGQDQFNPDVKGVFRLASGDSGSVNTANRSLEDSFSLDPLQIDQAYFSWAPVGKDGKADWEARAGKFAPNWENTILTLDPDVDVEGIAESFFKTDPHWRVNLAQLTPQKAGFLLINQVGYKDLATKGLDLYGTYTYMNDKAFYLYRDQLDKNSKNFNSALKNSMVLGDFALNSPFTQWELLARYQVNNLTHSDYPLLLTVDYLQSNYDTAAGATHELYKGAYANLAGGALKVPHDWKWWVEWGRAQPNAILGIWTKADRGDGGNTDYIALGAGYQWLTNIELDATVIDQNKFFPTSSKDGFTRIQLDALAKF